MPKRTVTTEQLRDIVRSRRTKGDAFRLNHVQYVDTQEKVKTELDKLSRQEILAKFAEYCYDVK